MGIYTFSQDNAIIPITTLSASATSNLECTSFNMSGYESACIVIMFSATLTSDNVLTLECGATDSADTSDATFHYRLGEATPGSSNADVYGADATSAALTLTAATYQGKTLLIELHSDELPTSGETVYNWVTVDFDGGASAATVMVYAILSKPRYAKAIMSTVVT